MYFSSPVYDFLIKKMINRLFILISRKNCKIAPHLIIDIFRTLCVYCGFENHTISKHPVVGIKNAKNIFATFKRWEMQVKPFINRYVLLKYFEGIFML